MYLEKCVINVTHILNQGLNTQPLLTFSRAGEGYTPLRFMKWQLNRWADRTEILHSSGTSFAQLLAKKARSGQGNMSYDVQPPTDFQTKSSLRHLIFLPRNDWNGDITGCLEIDAGLTPPINMSS